MATPLEIWQASNSPYIKEEFIDADDIDIDIALASRLDINKDIQCLLFKRHGASALLGTASKEQMFLENLLVNKVVASDIIATVYHEGIDTWCEYILENVPAASMSIELLIEMLEADKSTWPSETSNSLVKNLLKTATVGQIKELMDGGNISLPQLAFYVERLSCDKTPLLASATEKLIEEDFLLDCLSYILPKDIRYEYLAVDVGRRMQSYFPL